MMYTRHILVVLISIIVLSVVFPCCNQRSPEKRADKQSQIVSDSLTEVKNNKQSKDSVLMRLSEDVLKRIRAKDYNGLSGYVHPRKGIRFSPYGYIDTLQDLTFSKEQFSKADTSRSLLWGYYDGSGEPIQLSINRYFDKFVYDADFLNAPQKAVNRFLTQGNSLNNFWRVYPESDFITFYFPGFEQKYGGMDWKALRLVFRKLGDSFYLVAIIHDQWTI